MQVCGRYVRACVALFCPLLGAELRMWQLGYGGLTFQGCCQCRILGTGVQGITGSCCAAVRFACCFLVTCSTMCQGRGFATYGSLVSGCGVHFTPSSLQLPLCRVGWGRLCPLDQ